MTDRGSAGGETRSAALSSTELAPIVDALLTELGGARITDVARLEHRDDLLLFLERPTSGDRRALHIAVDAKRARICTTQRRYRRADFVTGPLVDRLRERLVHGEIGTISQPDPDERRVSIEVTHAEDRLSIEVELFGNRGLWSVCDAGLTIFELSRLPNIRGRELRPGARYTPPPPPRHRQPGRVESESPPPTRFESTGSRLLEEVDSHFTRLDEVEERHSELDRLRVALDRALARADQRVAGIVRQLESMEQAPQLRRDADLLLAYGFGLTPDATELRVPDPSDVEVELVILRTPGQPVQVQAEKLYQRARKYEDGRSHATAQLADARRDQADLQIHQLTLRSQADQPTEEALTAIREALIERGAIQRSVPASKPPARADKWSRRVRNEGFRRFVSIEGLPIFVGRNNAQNDRLSIRFARGNDLWFHVGAGYAGSHVVVRLDKNRSASLESLLDAGTLAAYYSKIRGTDLCEVIYTRAKHVSKPKGLPPGRVLTTQAKSLRIRIEPARLKRLLESSSTDDA